MDVPLEPDAEFPQGWDFNFPDQSYLNTLEVFEPPDASDLLEHTPTLFNDPMAMEDIGFLLDFGFPEIDTSNVCQSELIFGFETQDAAEIRLSSLSSSRSPSKSKHSTSTVPSPATVASTGPRTRTLDDFVGEFKVSRPNPLGPNHRSSYTREKRQKVGRVRKVGACVPCRLLKRPVSYFTLSINAFQPCF
jgi:hypothetical protein